MQHKRAYLDNAATSWPKPPEVYQAMDRYSRELGASPSRGTHRASLEARQIVDRTREKFRQLVNAKSEDLVIFCFNGTDALNLCIHGLVRNQDHVVSTVADHNSVLRPLRELEERQDVVVDLADCDQRGLVTVRQLDRFLNASTRLVVLPHASNVTGTIQDLAKLGAAAKEVGAIFMVDAAQTCGDIPIDMQAINIDILATSGHKGLFGPLGTGIAVIRAALVEEMHSFRQGGTGTQSEADRQPTTGAAKFESGSMNLPGIAGLEAGIDFVTERSKRNSDHRKKLAKRLLEGLHENPQVTVYGLQSMERRLPVISFNHASLDCHELSMILENEAHIQIRAGLHCAPRMHQALDTLARGGSARASIGAFNTEEEVQRLLDTIAKLG